MALSPETGLLPVGFGIRLDAATRSSTDGRTLIGGAPMRRVRLTEHAAKLLANLRTGVPAASPAARRLGRRLCDAGIAHPVPPPGGPDPAEVTCVVPVRDDPRGLTALLESLDSHQPAPGGLTIVEDGSRDPDEIAALATRWNARLIQRRGAQGPAGARNDGWRAASTPIVVFLDADVEVGADWLAPLLAHFADPTVAAVAPRVRAPGSPQDTLGGFERECSPLDMGARPSSVAPRRRVRYVPSAALLFRREVLEGLEGFDEDLRVGEDVDLVWRAVAAGWTVRYEPSVVVSHRNRPTWEALACQRFAYGTSAAALAQRHPQALAPLEMTAWGLAAWAALALGGQKGLLPAAAITAAAIGRLRGRLASGDGTPPAEVARIVLRGQLASGRQVAVAVRRAWLPLLGIAAAWPWGRRLAKVALLAEPLASWLTRRPGIGPLRWTAATLLSDASYCAGVWRGAIAERSAAALRPRLIGDRAPVPGTAPVAAGAARGSPATDSGGARGVPARVGRQGGRARPRARTPP